MIRQATRARTLGQYEEDVPGSCPGKQLREQSHGQCIQPLSVIDDDHDALFISNCIKQVDDGSAHPRVRTYRIVD